MTDDIQRLSALLAPRYAVHRELGRGGMAVVYAGRDLVHDRSVAIKVMSEEAGAAMGAERFGREAALVAQLQHPHIVPVIDSGRVGHQPFLVMPLVEGESLRVLLDRERQLPLRDVLAIARDVASALDYAHQLGIVHRDVKPENILLGDGGAVITDFGIAIGSRASGTTRLTEAGMVVGTPAYMSPEQSTGEAVLDGRTDIYSLACVLYEALAGRPPFAGVSAREVFARHMSDPVPPLRSARPDLPPSVEAALMRALAKAPVDRYRTASELVEDLPTGAISGTHARGRQRVRRALAAVAVLLVGTLGTVALRARRGDAFEAGEWVLIADLDNRTGLSLFDNSLAGALSVALEQSKYVNVLPKPTISRTLRAMGLSDTSRLTPTVARELAQRSNGSAVVFATIERAASGFSLTLRAEATATQRDLAVEQGIARSASDVLAVLDDLAARLRRVLGEKLRDGPPPVPLEFATTSSLDALRAWSEGIRHFRAVRYDAAVAAFQEAIALDSNFALAHKALGVTHYWLNNRAQGDVHFDRALALKNRLTERERLTVEADVASWRNRPDEAIRGYRRILELYPDDRSARTSLAYTLLRSSRWSEARAEYRALVAADTTDFTTLVNLATVYADLDSAHAALSSYARAFRLQPDQLDTDAGLVHEYAMTYADAGFPDSARALLDHLANGDASQRAMRLRSLALLDVRRGLGDSALVHFRAAAALSREVGNPTTEIRNRLYAARTLLWLGRTSDARAELAAVVPLLVPAAIDPPWIGLALELAAQSGDRSLTRRWAASMLAHADMASAVDRHAVYRAQAEEALLNGDVPRAVFTAESAVAAKSNAPALLVLARAYERAGRGAEARDRYAECARERLGGNENIFAGLACMGELSRLALAQGDTALAQQTARRLLARWPAADGAFPLRALVAKIARQSPG